MNILDYITSSASILIDRASDFVRYNLSGSNDTSEADNSNRGKEVYKKRIFTPLSYLTQLEWFYGEPTFIIDNIYIGSAINASHYGTLKNRDIAMVINMTHEISNYFQKNIEYNRFPVYDDNTQSIKQYLLKAYDKIIMFQLNNHGKNILVHCFMGASRSASVVIYYLMKKHGYTLNDAIIFCRNKRALINPTILFYEELFELDQHNRQNRQNRLYLQ